MTTQKEQAECRMSSDKWIWKSMEGQQRDYARITTESGSYIADVCNESDARLIVDCVNAYKARPSQAAAVRLTAQALREAADFVSCGEDDDHEREVAIVWRDAFTSNDGDAMPAGFYCYDTEYPEEGLHGPLGDDPAPASDDSRRGDVLAKAWYHYQPADEDGPEDYEIYSTEKPPCPECIPVLIVRADAQPRPVKPVACDDGKYMYCFEGHRVNGDKAAMMAVRNLIHMRDNQAPQPGADVLKDAARYRWLKSWNKTDGFDDHAIDREIAIDSAIAKHEGGGDE